MSALRRNLACNVIRIAEARGIPLSRVADRAHIGRTTLWQILDVNDRYPDRDPRLSTVEALAGTLEVSPTELLRPPPPNTERRAS